MIIAFLSSFIVMQLVEYFMWVYEKYPFILKILAMITFIIIFSQPIIVLHFANYNHLIKYYLTLQAILFVTAVLFFNLRVTSFTFAPYVADNHHWSWNWMSWNMYLPLFCIIYLVFFLGPLFTKQHYILFTLSILSLLYSMYNYFKHKTVSSMWCWIANFIIIVILCDALRKYVVIK